MKGKGSFNLFGVRKKATSEKMLHERVIGIVRYLLSRGQTRERVGTLIHCNENLSRFNL